MSSSARYLVRFTGNVQGVGFRATALSSAHGLDVHGFVRNQPDGSVLMDVDGSPAQLRELMGRINQAMSHRIDHADVDELPCENRSDGFHIRG